MAITFAKPSAASLRELDRGVRTVSRLDKDLGGRLKARTRAAAAVRAPLDQMPHKVYTIGLEDLASGAGRAKLGLIATRYILDPADEGGAAGEVYCDEGEKTHAFGDVNLGPFTQQTLQVIGFLGKDPKVQADDYEFSVIRIPALYTFAVWLRHKDPAKDLVIKLDPDKPTTVRPKARALEDFLASVQKEAQKALKAHRDLAM